jgi:hypothetical protein
VPNFLTAQAGLGGRCGADRTTLHGFAYIGLEGTAIVCGRCEPRKAAYPTHEPKSGSIDSGTDAGIASFQTDQGRYGYPQPLGPSTLGFAATNSRNREVLAQCPQGLGGRWWEYL